MQRFSVLGMLTLVLLAFSSLPAQVESQAAFTVNPTADATDANPGDGTCATESGECTLRAAIQEANALPGADTITLPAGTYTLAIPSFGEDPAATGDLGITADLTINGAGAATTIVDGGGRGTVFRIVGGTAEISGMTIRNGLGQSVGGGIFNEGTLTLNESTVTDNSSQSGAGIYNDGTLTLNGSTVSGNTGGSGAGIYNGGTLTVNSSIVSDNSASGAGAGIYNGGTLTVNSSIVSDNSADGSGGGIYNIFGSLTLNSSTVSDNSGRGGGGIFNGFGPAASVATVNGSTVSGNAARFFGGGVFNDGDLTLTSSTISGNSASAGGGGVFNSLGGFLTLYSSTVNGNSTDGSGGGVFNTFTASLKNTIISGSTAGGNCFGEVSSLGFNLSSDDTCAFGSRDMNSTDPVLGPLQDNGGPTHTHALQAGSPAIDAVPPADCTDVSGKPVATDQRGVDRPQAAACDIGAYEAADPTQIPTPTPGEAPRSGLPPTGGPGPEGDGWTWPHSALIGVGMVVLLLGGLAVVGSWRTRSGS